MSTSVCLASGRPASLSGSVFLSSCLLSSSLPAFLSVRLSIIIRKFQYLASKQIPKLPDQDPIDNTVVVQGFVSHPMWTVPAGRLRNHCFRGQKAGDAGTQMRTTIGGLTGPMGVQPGLLLVDRHIYTYTRVSKLGSNFFLAEYPSCNFLVVCSVSVCLSVSVSL